MVETRVAWLEELASEHSRRSGSNPARPNSRTAADAVAYLSGGYPNRRGLPKDTVIDATSAALERAGEWALQYGPSHGDTDLIEALLAKLGRDQDIQAGPENVLISAGASQALALATQMLVEPGDAVLSEVPTWTGAVKRFTVHGADVREVPSDDQGIDVAEVERALNDLQERGHQAKLIYVIPNFQNPTGVTMTLECRQQLVKVAAQHGVPIIEDDAYFDLRYDGDFLPTLYELDQAGNVIYMGTFSKNMAAGMRLGWAIADPEIIDRMSALKTEGGTNMFASQVAAEWVANGTLSRHVQDLRALYRRHRDTMLSALEREMPDGVTWTRPDGGFFIWLTLPEGCDAKEIAAKAAEQGVVVRSGMGFYFTGRGSDNLRLSYSFPSEQEIEDGIRILADVIRDA